MSLGHQLKQLITLNWREKIISLLLAFLFWFMIKAQDVRPPTYTMPPPTRIPMASSPAPSQLTPVIPSPVELSSELESSLSPPKAAVTPSGKSREDIKGASGL